MLGTRNFNDILKPQDSELQKKYDEHVHKSITFGTRPQGGGTLFLMNVFGDPVVAAVADNKNAGQVVTFDADKEITGALPAGK